MQYVDTIVALHCKSRRRVGVKNSKRKAFFLLAVIVLCTAVIFTGCPNAGDDGSNAGNNGSNAGTGTVEVRSHSLRVLKLMEAGTEICVASSIAEGYSYNHLDEDDCTFKDVPVGYYYVKGTGDFCNGSVFRSEIYPVTAGKTTVIKITDDMLE